MGAYQAQHWSDFGVAVAGAAAALAGLLFVALSINLERILAGQRLPARAAHTLVLVSAPLVIGVVLLVPGQTDNVLGSVLLALGVAVGVILAALNPPWRRSRNQPFMGWVGLSATPALVLPVCIVVGGAGLMTETLGGLYWFPVGVVVAFLAALLNAWVLMVEILR